MAITRRAFTAGALSAARRLRLRGPGVRARLARRSAGAIAAIRAYGEDASPPFRPARADARPHDARTGFRPVLDFGFANRDARAPITPDTLFQIGSISKSMTAARDPPARRRGAAQAHRPR